MGKEGLFKAGAPQFEAGPDGGEDAHGFGQMGLRVGPGASLRFEPAEDPVCAGDAVPVLGGLYDLEPPAGQREGRFVPSRKAVGFREQRRGQAVPLGELEMLESLHRPLQVGDG